MRIGRRRSGIKPPGKGAWADRMNYVGLLCIL